MDAITPTIPYFDNPQGIDLVIQSIQRVLYDSLNPRWLTHAYGRAWSYPDNNMGNVPKVWTEKREYLTVIPNDNYDSHCFMYVNSDEFNTDISRTEYDKFIEVDLVLIFSIKLEDTPDFPYTQSLKPDVDYVLSKIKIIKNFRSFTDIPERVWRDFDVSGWKKSEKWGFMRYDFTVRFNTGCYDDIIDVGSPIIFQTPNTDTATTREYIAGENIVAYRAIMVRDGLAFHYDSTDINNYGSYVGIALNAGLTGDIIKVATNGTIETPFPTITGEDYYSDANGLIGTGISITGLGQIVATGGGANHLNVHDWQPIQLV